MKAFVFVNDNASAYIRYYKGDIPRQFIYGVTELHSMGYEVKVASGNFLSDLFDFVKFKPQLFFMPFIKRKTFIFFMLAKLLSFDTKFVGWLHLDIFAPPKGKLKKFIHSLFLPLLTNYIRALDSIFFLSEKTMAEMLEFKKLCKKKCKFIPWGGDREFYKKYLKNRFDGNIISTGRENRDLPIVFQSLINTSVNIDVYTSDNSLADFYRNADGIFKINKGFWPYKELLEKVSIAKAMIIPLRQDKIDYCVGLSSLIEAISLGRPVIATYNPYWYIDIEAENIGIVIKENTPQEWKLALEKLASDEHLVQTMSNNALRLFEEKCNFDVTEKLLARSINSLFGNNDLTTL